MPASGIKLTGRPGINKGTLARTLIGLYGQVTSLPDRRKAYGSSPLTRQA
jgi:hypothetical protein